MDTVLNVTRDKMEKAIQTMEKRFTQVRTGRANPSMLDGVMVMYYGTPTPLQHVATISIHEARTLAVKPFDRSTIKDVEKAINEANLGLNPNNTGESILINIPPLTEETRKEYVKQVKHIAEEGRIALRNIRQEANTDMKKLELPEDEEKRGETRVQDLIQEFNKIVDEKLKEKEAELMEV